MFRTPRAASDAATSTRRCRNMRGASVASSRGRRDRRRVRWTGAEGMRMAAHGSPRDRVRGRHRARSGKPNVSPLRYDVARRSVRMRVIAERTALPQRRRTRFLHLAGRVVPLLSAHTAEAQDLYTSKGGRSMSRALSLSSKRKAISGEHPNRRRDRRPPRQHRRAGGLVAVSAQAGERVRRALRDAAQPQIGPIVAQYEEKRSALIPLAHLFQEHEGIRLVRTRSRRSRTGSTNRSRRSSRRCRSTRCSSAGPSASTCSRCAATCRAC